MKELRSMVPISTGAWSARRMRGGAVVVVIWALATVWLTAGQAPETNGPAGNGPGARGPQGPGALTVMPPADAVAVEKYPPLDKTGNFKIAPATTWADVPAMTKKEGIAKGTVPMFTMRSEDTQMYPGVL